MTKTLKRMCKWIFDGFIYTSCFGKRYCNAVFENFESYNVAFWWELYLNISLSSVQSYEHSRIVNFSCMLHFLSGKTLENCTCGVFSKLATVLAALVGDRQSMWLDLVSKLKSLAFLRAFCKIVDLVWQKLYFCHRFIAINGQIFIKQSRNLVTLHPCSWILAIASAWDSRSKLSSIAGQPLPF